MSGKRQYRRFTVEEKLAILKESEQPGVTAAAVCRKHAISPNLLYGWRAVAQKATEAALKGPDKPDEQVERLRAELARLRAVVSEITAENLELKKKI
ncbi:MAG: transposase [Deltaproteobacteria bacterium]|nr:transposase [Deltaproteobacteria bacterium]